ncbi:MAG: HD domain-containing protein [Solirubrobacterales bacterium]
MQFPGATPEEIAFAKRRARVRRSSIEVDGSFFVALLISFVLVVPPALIGWFIAQSGSEVAIVYALLAGATSSLCITFVAGSIWRRRTDDRLFADATITGWLRRARADRAVGRAREDFADPNVASIELHVDRLTAIAKSLEARDARTHRHSARVAHAAVVIAKEMELPPEEVSRVRAAARLHDIGALKVPAFIHSTEAEQVARAAAGAEIVEFTGDRALIKSIRHQREHFDGSGAPEGLAGVHIPVTARILAVADAYDRIATEHGQSAALVALDEGAGTTFDPRIVEAFCVSAKAGPTTALRGALAGAFPRAAQGAVELLRGTASVAAAASIATTAVVAGGVATEQHRAGADSQAAQTGAGSSAVHGGSAAAAAGAAGAATSREKIAGHRSTGKGNSSAKAETSTSSKSSGDSGSGSNSSTSGHGGDSSGPGRSNSTSSGSSKGVVDQVGGTVGQTVDQTSKTVNDTVGAVGQTVDKTVGTVGQIVDQTTKSVGDTVGGVVGGLGGKTK